MPRKRKIIKNISNKKKKKKKNEIERLKEEVKSKENKLLDGETNFLKLLTDVKYEKHSSLNDIALLEPKLIKLEISPERIDRIKNSVLLF